MHALPHIDLIFEGLDTYATVELDGTNILEYALISEIISGSLMFFRTNNMFVPYRVDLKPRLAASDCATEHSLVITFRSTFLKGRSLQRENAGKTPVAKRADGAGGGAGSLYFSSLSV